MTDATATGKLARRGLLLALLISMSALLPQLLLGALAIEVQNDLHIGEAAFGALMSLYFLSSAIVATRSGAFARRVSSQAAAMATAGLSAACLLIVAVAPPLIPLAMVTGGCALALSVPTGNLILARNATAGRHGLFFGLRQTGPPLAGVLAGLGVTLAVMSGSWRWPVLLATAVPLMTGVFIRGRWAGVLGPSAAVIAQQSAVADGGRDAGIRDDRWRRDLKLLSVAGGLGTLSVSSLTSFIAGGLHEAGLAPQHIGPTIAGVALAGIGTRIVAGWYVDGHLQRLPWMIAILMWTGAVGFILLSFRGPVTALVGALLAYAGGWGWSGLVQFAVVQRAGRSITMGSAIVQRGLSLGAALGPVTFGWVAGRSGLADAWLLLMGASLAAGFVAVWSLRRGESVRIPGAV